MPGFELSESAEETLARLWVASEEHHRPGCPAEEFTVADRDGALAQLIAAGLIGRADDVVALTEAGKAEAALIIRRERLAERLLTDVLSLGQAQAAEAACQFEHHLTRGIDDEICTLLGHPKACPHGSSIPAGECCRLGARAAETVISSLADLAPGDSGVIAYLLGRRRDTMQRMLALGVVPGASVTLQQRTPSLVFALGQTQVAVDRETAQDIYVRITGRQRAVPVAPAWLSGRLRRFRRGRRGR